MGEAGFQALDFVLEDYGPPWNITIYPNENERNQLLLVYFRNASEFSLLIGGTIYHQYDYIPVEPGQKILCYSGSLVEIPNKNLRIFRSGEYEPHDICFELVIESQDGTMLEPLDVKATNPRIFYK